jgi:DNA-directed RNA polymerase specialized sigma24 family protein
MSLAATALEAALTPAEAEALFLAAEGMGYAEIGARLHISIHAVECRLSSARQKILRQSARRESLAWRQSAERTAREKVAWFDELLTQAEA